MNNIEYKQKNKFRLQNSVSSDCCIKYAFSVLQEVTDELGDALVYIRQEKEKLYNIYSGISLSEFIT